MSEESRRTFSLTIHPWCSSQARDEAVRAAEDGRTGPLPTLAEAISAVSPLPGRVDGTHWADWERLRDERDAAIRERDEAKQLHARECEKCSALADKMIALRARVASLESQLEIVACRAATAENRVAELESAAKLAPAANAADGSNHAAPAASGAAGTEPDAWGVRRSGGIDAVAHRLFRSSAEQSAEQNGGTVVPLYASPPPAPGWLTEEDRETLLRLSYVVDYAQYATSADFIRSLLARSTPPEVVLPKCEFTSLGNYEMGFLEAIGRVKRALAAAGVTVTEANR